MERRVRLVAGAATFVLACGVVAAFAHRGSPHPTATLVRQEAPPTTSRPATTTTTATTVVATTDTTATTVASAPSSTGGGARVTSAAPPVDDAPASSLDSAGLYSLDRSTGSIVRLGDTTVFDTAGNTVEYASGMSVYRMAPGGGDSSLVYTLPELIGDPGLASGWDVDRSREHVGWIEAANDGHAVVSVSAPMVSASGVENGGISRIFLVDPAGHPLVELQGAEAEWSRDGSLLAVYDYRGLSVLRADGEPVFGPVATDGMLRHLRWVPGKGAIVATRNQDGAILEYTIASGAWTTLDALMMTADVGPDGRIVGNRLTTVEMTDADYGTIIFDPRDGSSIDFARGTSNAMWSPDGSAVLLTGAARSEPADGIHYSLRVLGADASLQQVLECADGLHISLEHSPMITPPGPQWTLDGRYVLFEVTPG